MCAVTNVYLHIKLVNRVSFTIFITLCLVSLPAVSLVCSSERGAADTTQMKELEGILTEARNLESYLKEKKCNLRQTLALISNKLQS
uniref:Uncharacterized protein n=1 Tax=Xiphophorus couchianus TaxID=32473 RepID=A0A3B5KX50_9TELE